MKRSMPYILGLAVLMSAPSLYAAKTHSEDGMIQIYVVNEDGQAVAGAPIFIAQKGKIQHAESNAAGLVNLTLPEGGYQISSAVTRPYQDVLERFVSGPAHIQVVSHDTASVILTLRAIGDPVPELTLSTLQKIGVAEEVAKYLN